MSDLHRQPNPEHLHEPGHPLPPGRIATRPGPSSSSSPRLPVRVGRIGEAVGRGHPKVAPELLKVGEVAGLLGCSGRQVYRLADGGKMPRPVKLGGSVRWRRREVQDWIDAGCPSVRAARAGGTRK